MLWIYVYVPDHICIEFTCVSIYFQNMKNVFICIYAYRQSNEYSNHINNHILLFVLFVIFQTPFTIVLPLLLFFVYFVLLSIHSNIFFHRLFSYIFRIARWQLLCTSTILSSILIHINYAFFLFYYKFRSYIFKKMQKNKIKNPLLCGSFIQMNKHEL